MNAAAPRIILPWPDSKILVSELAPDAEDLQPLGLVAVDQKVVSHGSIGDAARHVPCQIVTPRVRPRLQIRSKRG